MFSPLRFTRDSRSRRSMRVRHPGVDGGRPMARAYSQDLRDRVIDAGLSGMRARQAAARFGVGIATAIVWVRRARASGEGTARREGNAGGSRFDPDGGSLLAVAV